jgi:hydrophobe/amphiphile efflux-1 (HAE1) family protein
LRGIFLKTVRHLILKPFRYLLIYALIVGLMALLFLTLPTSFLPDEDQGALTVQIRLPPGATQERTLKVIAEVEQHFLENEKDLLKGMFASAGTGSSGNRQNVARAFIRLVDWSQRPLPEQSAQAVAERANKAFKRIRDASVVVRMPSAVRGLGNAAGFEVRLQDRAGLGHEALTAAREEFIRQAGQDERLTGVRDNGQADTAQYHIDLDIAQAGAMGVTVAAINDTLSTAWGGSYVSDFIDRGRVKKVYVQGEAATRMLPDDLKLWYVRNAAGEMVPFSAFAQGRWVHGPPTLERFNGMEAVEISGEPVKGVSSGTAMQIVDDIIRSLPDGIGYEWSGMSAQEKESGSQAPFLYAVSLLVVFLALAALYESWSIPFSIMLVMPLGIVGALLATYTRGLSNDVYFQAGLLATIGLSAKNAILIVEFAKELMAQGMGLIEATLEAVRIRLRPILMTSFAFMLGVLPLVISTGAGSGSQHSVGTGVMGGMFSATVLGIFFVPVFFVVVRKLFQFTTASQ